MSGVVSEPTGGFELGQEIVNSAVAGLGALIDIIASIFHVYVVTTTMFLLVISFLFAIIYFVGQWPSDYGTRLQYRRTKRSVTGLLLLAGLVPILYTAGWIGTRSTSHGGLPEDGMFGSGFEERIIGMSLDSDGLGMVADIAAAFFRIYLATLTSALIVIAVLFVSARILTKLQAYGTEMSRERARRSVVGLLLAVGTLPLLYAAGWVGSGSTSHDGLPQDGIFGTPIEERIIGPTIGSDGLQMFTDIGGAIFRMYLITLTTVFIALSVFFIATHILGRVGAYEADIQHHRALRSIMGLLLVTAAPPILYAAGWVGSGAVSHDGLPQDGLFGTPIEERIIGPAIGPDGLQMFTDIGGAIFRMYLITLTTVFLALSVFFIATHLLGRVGDYESDSEHRRALRSVVGLFLVSATPPILYAAGWVGSGAVSHDGLPQDGLFGTPVEERIIGPDVPSEGLGAFVDIGVSIFRMYFATLTTLFLVLSVMAISVRLLGILRSYETDTQYDRTWRFLVGLLAVTGFLPLLYAPVWVAEGTQSPGGYNLPSDGVFGTNIEDRIFGPDVGDGGFGELVSILASVVNTYQVTISFVFITLVVFLGLVYAYTQWPNELQTRNFQGQLKRVGLGLLTSLAFIPVLHAVGWLATGVFKPEESVSRVSPRVSLSSQELYQGPNYHPFIQDLSVSSDPLAAVLRNILQFQSMTIIYVGIAAVVTGLLVYTVFGHSNYIQTNLGKQSFRGGVILIIIAFLIPFLITGAAWVATGVPDHGYLGSGPPGFSSKCTSFAGGMDGWDTREGHHTETVDPAGIELDGTISKEFEALGLGDRSVTLQSGASGKEFTVRVYADGEQIFEKTTTGNESFIFNADKDIRVEVSSSGGLLKEFCVGYEPASDPQLAISLHGPEDDEPIILRRGVGMQYTVYNTGDVRTGSEFDVHFVLGGSDPWGEESMTDTAETVQPLAGGEFSERTGHIDSFPSSPPTGDVQVVGYVDPYGELDERTTVPNSEQMSIDVVYANMFGHIDAPTVNNNATDIQTRVVNNGTIYSDPTTAEVTIYDEDGGGEVVRSWTVPIQNLSAGESTEDSLNHTFESPGNYTAEVDVDEFLFPRGSIDQEQIQLVDGDIHASLTDVEDETRVDTTTEATVVVTNEGNADFDNGTTATVSLVDSGGAVTQEKEIAVPPLQQGETFNQSVQLTPESGGVHTIRLDVTDTTYPAGSNDTAEITSLGPSFTGEVTAENVFETEQSGITATVTNNGNAYSDATEMELVLQDPNGTAIESSTYDVPELSTGESHVIENPFGTRLDDSGQYDVSMEVASTPRAAGMNDTTSFEVYSFDLALDANPVAGTDEVAFDVSLTNLANTSTTTNMDLSLTVRNTSNQTVTSETLSFSSLASNETQTESTSLELANNGTHTAVAELQVGKEDTETVQFSHSWPNLRAAATATETQVNGSQTTIQTAITNVGSTNSTATTATVRVYPAGDHSSPVDSTTLDIAPIDIGETLQRNATVNFPDQGTYVAEVEVADEEFPENNINTTGEIEVSQSELSIQLVEQRANVPAGEEGAVELTIENIGSDESSSLPVQTVFTGPNGQTVANISDEVSPLAPGESTTLTHTTTLSEVGTHSVESTVESDIAGTVRSTSQIDVVKSFAVSVSAEQSQVAAGSGGAVNVTVYNVGDSTTDPSDLQVVFSDPDGQTTATFSEEVSGIGPNETVSYQFNSTLEKAGVYTIEGELAANDYTATDSTQIEATQPGLTLDVTAENSQIGSGDEGTFLAEVTNSGTAPTEERTLRADVAYEDGTAVDEWEMTVEPLQPGESTTIQLSSTEFNETGQYTGTVEVAKMESGWLTGSSEIEVSPAALTADVSAVSVEEGSPVDITTTVENTGLSASNATTATATIEQSGVEVAEQTFDIQELNPGESQQNTPFDRTLEPGSYDVSIAVDSGGSTVRDSGSFEVTYWDLSGELVASDERRDNQHEITVQISNDGTGQSSSTTATVNISAPSGDAVAQEQIDVPAISAGGTYTHDVSFEADEGGEYTADVDVVDEDRPDGTTDQANFVVTWANLTTSISADSVVEDEQADFHLSVVNQGPGESYETTATINIRDNFGNILQQYTVDVPVLQSGETYETTVTHQFERPGTYQGQADVAHPEFPDETVDSTGEIQISHANLNGQVAFSSASSNVGTDTTLSAQVVNAGNNASESTTAAVEIERLDGQIVFEEQVDIPPLEPGDSSEVELNATINTSDTHVARITVDDPEFPMGNTDEDRIEIYSPDLQTGVAVEDTRINDQTTATIDIVNEGQMTAESTTVELLVYNPNDRQVVREVFDVPSLAPGESTQIQHTQRIASECWRTSMTCAPGATIGPGTYTATANVSVTYAEEGSSAEDTFEVREE